MNRQLERRLTRVIGTHAVGQVIPDAPRRLKRLCGRMYGNAAFRQMNILEDGKGEHRYGQYKLHKDVLNWIENEVGRVKDEQNKLEAEGVGTEGTESVGEGNAEADRVSGDREAEAK